MLVIWDTAKHTSLECVTREIWLISSREEEGEGSGGDLVWKQKNTRLLRRSKDKGSVLTPVPFPVSCTAEWSKDKGSDGLVLGAVPCTLEMLIFPGA